MSLLIIVLEVLAILANFCVPAVQGMRRGAQADGIVREMLQIQTAAEAEHHQRGAWPASAASGTAPDDLGAFLPPAFAFQHADYQFQWQRWALAAPPSADGLSADDPSAAPTQEFAGVTVETHDPRLAAMVARRLAPGVVRMTLGNRTTLVVDAPGAPDTN